MQTIFRPDGPVFRTLSKLAELMALNVLFLLCCLPVVTAGASITALYGALFLPEEGGAFRRFFREFRRNFRQGTVLELILGGLGLLLLADVWLVQQMEGYALVKYVLYLSVLLWLGVSIYAFALAARFTDQTRRVLKNALLLSVSMLPRTVLLVIIDILPVLMILLVPDVFLRFLILWLLVAFAGCAWLKTWVLTDVFRQLKLVE